MISPELPCPVQNLFRELFKPYASCWMPRQLQKAPVSSTLTDGPLQPHPARSAWPLHGPLQRRAEEWQKSNIADPSHGAKHMQAADEHSIDFPSVPPLMYAA